MEKYYWLLIIGALVLLYIFMIVRQKRQEKRSLEVLNSFKVGDKVVTHIGIYGKIKRIYETSFGKTCILEIGNNNKIDIELDMRYIAGLDEKVMVADNANSNQKETETAQDEVAVQEETAPKMTKNNKTNSKKEKKN